MRENLLLGLLSAVLWSGVTTFIYWREKNCERFSRLYSAYVPQFCLLIPVYTLLLPKYKRIMFLHGALQLLPGLLLLTLLLQTCSPRLRRLYSARSCADLWLLPGLLTSIFLYRWYATPDPWLTLRVPGLLFRLLLELWFAGFCAVMSWKIVGHLRFRRMILQRAAPVSRQERALFRQIWSDLDPKDRRLDKRVKLVYTPSLSSPLTVGLFSRTVCLALPLREYSKEELRLIFRHESIHLLRRDNLTKFSTGFLCAFGWFIPSAWMVMRRAAEDLELCCDELVTEGMEQEERKEYAHLLLCSAGTERGFTTCLSASAKGLRYRLRRVMHPYGKSAIVLIALLTAVFVFFSGTVGVELDMGTVQAAFQERDQRWHVSAIDPGRGMEPVTDPAVTEAVEAYLGKLKLTRPLWILQAPADKVAGQVYVTLTGEDGRTAVLCLRENELYYLLPEDTGPKPLYRIIGDFDIDALRLMAAQSG